MTTPPGGKLAAQLTSVLQVAADACSAQDYPPATLYVIATPIGNLADISVRALHVLQRADLLACEDTRHTQALLRAYGIDKSPSQWMAAHQHNEAQAGQTVIERLQQGLRVAYVSDAGTPAVSDPGARVVAAVRQAGFRVIPLPGASSVTAVLSAAGVSNEADSHHGFVFTGFLPNKAGERTLAVSGLQKEARAMVVLEAPHRIEALANALAILGERQLTVGRELTKQFEQIVTINAQDFPTWLAQDPNHSRGEFVLVVHPEPPHDAPTVDDRVLRLLLAELPLKTAVRLAAEITGQARNALYELALGLKADKRL